MSTSFIYQILGMKGYHYLRSEFHEGCLTITVAKKREDFECSECGSHNLRLRGKVVRFFKAVPVGKKPMEIKCTIPRVECLDCEVIRQINPGFADPWRRYTKQFERYVVELCQVMTMLDVARHLDVGWDVIKDIQKDYLKKKYLKPHLKHVRLIAIDEISIGKHHRYVTVVLDLESGAVLFVGDGKGSDALIPFWKRLRCSGAQVKAVAIDMSPAYIEAVTENLKQAALVFDHFHIIKLYNKKLSELRRKIQREATEGLQKEVLKGTAWILLKNPENLDDDHNERARLEEAIKLNKPLATAYYMKEDLRELWNKSTKKEATRFLNDWIKRAYASGISMLRKFGQTLSAHKSGILAYFKFPISTGPLEGTNNKIRTLQKIAYGFRDSEFFKLKILALHRMKYAFVG